MKKIFVAFAVAFSFVVVAHAGNFTNVPVPNLKIPLLGIERSPWVPSSEESGDYISIFKLKRKVPAPATNNLPVGVTIKTWDSQLYVEYEVVASASEIAAKSGTNTNVKIKKVFNDKEDAIGNQLILELP